MCEEYCKNKCIPEVNEFFWQLVLEKEFVRIVLDKLSISSASGSTVTSSPRKLKKLLCVIYTAGCVLRKVENKYVRQQRHSDEARQCVTAVREMAGKLRTSQHHSCDFINSIDRGGLYHVQDSVYNLFVVIELMLTKNWLISSPAKEKTTR